MSMGIHESNLRPMGYQLITQTPGVSFRLTVPNDATVALLKAEGGVIRFRDDGVIINDVEAFPLADGESFFYIGDLRLIEFNSLDGAAILHVLFYKRG